MKHSPKEYALGTIIIGTILVLIWISHRPFLFFEQAQSGMLTPVEIIIGVIGTYVFSIVLSPIGVHLYNGYRAFREGYHERK